MSNRAKVIFILGMVFVILVGLGTYYYHDYQKQNKTDYLDTNYYGLVSLGLAPNSEPRLATAKDIDTGLKGSYMGQKFGLFESRTWEEGDYGKTFISPIFE